MSSVSPRYCLHIEKEPNQGSLSPVGSEAVQSTQQFMAKRFEPNSICLLEEQKGSQVTNDGIDLRCRVGIEI